MDNKTLNKKYGYICINETQDRFNDIIQRLPSLLKDGWKMPEEGAIDKKLAEGYFVCEYSGNDFTKVYLHISLHNKNKGRENIHLMPLVAKGDHDGDIPNDEAEKIYEHFQNMLKDYKINFDYIPLNF